MNKFAILLSLVLASGTVLAGGEYDHSTGAADEDPGAAERTISGSTHPDMIDPDASFSEVDANADGLISEDEAQGSQQLADNFDQADVDADGYVNQSEYDSLLGEQTLQE